MSIGAPEAVALTSADVKVDVATLDVVIVCDGNAVSVVKNAGLDERLAVGVMVSAAELI